MAEATYKKKGDTVHAYLGSAVDAGQVVQLPDGRAGVAKDYYAADARGEFYVEGIFTVAKTTTMVVLIGSKLFWDASANAAHLLHRNDKDFYLGVSHEDAASADTSVTVDLNADPVYAVGLEHGFVSVPINTAGFPFAVGAGRNGCNLGFSATNEAQKADALSHRAFAVGTPAIVDALICINSQGDNAALDLSVGIANATHASNADSITESLFAHLDGNALDISLESDDGTTEVAATDSTFDAVAGTPFLVQFDLRDYSDIQCYINGVLMLGATVFKLNAAVGPLRVLAHLEKSADDTPGNVSVLNLGVRTFDV